MNFIDNHKLCVAPMMQYTDMHDRYLLRLISKHAFLYTEMVTTNSLVFGDAYHQLNYNNEEHPVAIQFGGYEIKDLVECSKKAEKLGFDEINLNVGCPSDRVQKGKFGAILMLEPNHVANILSSIQDEVSIPVSIKCRLGVDDNDSYEYFSEFVNTIFESGIKNFIIHARKGYLKGLSPRQNRSIPPLKYDYVYRIKKEIPNINIIINGGIKNAIDGLEHLNHVDGIMLGREAYDNPMILLDLENKIYKTNSNINRIDILEKYLEYVDTKLTDGFNLTVMLKHLFGLNKGLKNSKLFKKIIHQTIKDGDLNKLFDQSKEILIN